MFVPEHLYAIKHCKQNMTVYIHEDLGLQNGLSITENLL
jgi:hypothetical protein